MESTNSSNVNLLSFYDKFKDEQTCRAYLAELRWGKDKTICPHCGSINDSYRYKDGKLFKCKSCQKQFTVRVGTVFEDSMIPLQKWFLAIYLATSLKSGISSIQLSKYLGVTQKTAWFMLHRIRKVIELEDLELSGTVETDETYIGGKVTNRPMRRRNDYDEKQVVFGMVERSGKTKMKHVKSSGARSLLPEIEKSIDRNSSKVFSDDWGSYKSLKKLGFIHEIVNHHLGEYVNGDVHTNTIEGVWSQLKRGVNGIYHHVSPKHLQRYCDEYGYRYNTRELNDFERFNDWFRFVNEKRLTYKKLTTTS